LVDRDQPIGRDQDLHEVYPANPKDFATVLIEKSLHGEAEYPKVNEIDRSIVRSSFTDLKTYMTQFADMARMAPISEPFDSSGS
jgi:hypothetical protein